MPRLFHSIFSQNRSYVDSPTASLLLEDQSERAKQPLKYPCDYVQKILLKTPFLCARPRIITNANIRLIEFDNDTIQLFF
jgi:hypothetical protein